MAVEAKICGLTRVGDALHAERLGAAALGVVFAGGPRRVDVSTARAIAGAVGLPVFGVFGAATLDDILRTVEAARLGGVQLHDGGPAPAVVAERAGVPVWRVVRLAGEADLADLAPRGATAVLVEPRVGGRLGGTGRALDLGLARAARNRLRGGRMVLAGGLGPATVADAIAAVGPDVVDVSSGVEAPNRPGIKDPERVAAFLEAVRGR